MHAARRGGETAPGENTPHFHGGKKEFCLIMRKMKIFPLVLAAVLLLTCGAAVAQVPTGRIVGRVVDDQGQALPGVGVVAESPRLVGKTEAVTDETGTFRLFSLPSGTYTITFSLPGFNTLVREGIILQLEQTLTLNVSLDTESVEEEIVVTGMSPLIDVKSTTKGQTLTREVFEALPKGRDFNALISTLAGVHYEGNQGGLSVDGASGGENIFYIDGTNITNIHIGTQAQSAVFELVDEVQVKASGYNAEFGGSMGGVVNVITRSGGNQFRGEFIGYYDDESRMMLGKTRDYLRLNPLNADEAQYVNNDDLYFNGGKDRDIYQRFEGVFSLGGYILKDKLWFYGSFNPIYRLDKADRFFLTDPQPRPITTFEQKRTNWNGALKLTAQPMRNMRVTVSGVNNFYRYRGALPSITGSSSKTYDYALEGMDYPNMSANATVDYAPGNNFLVSLRGGYFSQDETNQQIFMPETRWLFSRANTMFADEIPADLIRASGWRNWMGSVLETKKRKYERISTNLDFTYYMNLGGEHAWKAGIQFIRLREDVDRGAQHPLVYLNWNAPYYLMDWSRVQGKYGSYSIISSWTSPYGYVWDIKSDNWALYLQDTWTIGEKLTLNIGVRTESEYIPSFSKEPGFADMKPIQFGFDQKLAPRLGAVYDVFGDSSLKVFGSFGIYYDVMKLYMAEGAFGGFKWKTDYYTLDDWDWTKIAASGDITDRASQEAGGTYKGTIDWRLPSFDTTDPDLKPVGQMEISFGAEQKLRENLSFSVRVVNKSLLQTIEDIGVATPEGELYYNANPGGKYINDIYKKNLGPEYPECPKATREYWGVNLSLEKRFSNNWQGGVNYTWSRLTGNYGGLASADEGGRVSPNVLRYYDLWFLAYDLKLNVLDGPLPSDRPHYFKAYGSYAFPFGLTVGAVGYARSGLPLTNALLANHVTIYPNNRFDTNERLPFTMWADFYAEYNLRIAGRYRININLNVYNITNTSTIQGKNQTINRYDMYISDEDILAKNYSYEAFLSNRPGDRNPLYGLWSSRMGPWSARLGFKFTF
jgi:hypothetical protein